MPKWSSRLSGSGTEFHLVDISLEDAVKKKPQGPVAEFLFCADCDGRMGIGEQLLRELIHPSVNKPQSILGFGASGISLKGRENINNLYFAFGGLILKAHLAEDKRWKTYYLNRKQLHFVLNGMKNDNLVENLEVKILKLYTLENFKIGNFSDSLKELHKISPYDAQFSSAPTLFNRAGFSTVLMFGGMVIVLNFYSRGYNNTISGDEVIQIPTLPLDLRYLLEQDPKNILGLKTFLNSTDISNAKFVRALKNTQPEAVCPCRVSYSKVKDGPKGNLSFKECCGPYWGLSKN